MRNLILILMLLGAACGYQPAKEVVVVAPGSESTAPTDDSTYLSVTVLDSTFKLKVLDKAATVRDAAGVNDFIAANRSMIDSDRITIHTGNIPFEKYKPVIEVMSKHGYRKFRMAKN
jgi:hypothetical protein